MNGIGSVVAHDEPQTSPLKDATANETNETHQLHCNERDEGSWQSNDMGVTRA